MSPRRLIILGLVLTLLVGCASVPPLGVIDEAPCHLLGSVDICMEFSF